MRGYYLLILTFLAIFTLNSAPVLLPVTPIIQKKDFCGEASVAMILTLYGKPVSQDYVHDSLFGLSHTQRGAYSTEMVSSLRRAGYSIVTESHYPLNTREYLPEATRTRLIQLFKKSIDEAQPVIYGWYPQREIITTFYGHFSVIVGYDESGFYIIDPRIEHIIFYTYEDFSRYLLLPTLDFKQWGYFFLILGRDKS